MSRRARSAVKLVDGLSVLFALLDVERADRPAADAAGEARAREQRNRIAGRRQADLPAEEEDHVLRRVLASAAATAAAATAGIAGAELEDAGVLEEEVALLREEQVEARQVDLLLVGLDLREVGVDGEVPRQSRRHAVLHVEAGVVVLVERHAGELVQVRERVRLDADVGARPQALQAFISARHRDARQLVNAAQRRPVAVLVLAAQPPLEVDAPVLHRLGTELQRLERNLDLRVPAVFADARADVPDAVPVRVLIAALVRHLRIPLRAARIDRELVAVALVVERVDDDLEAVGGAGVEVLAQLVDDDRAGLGILREHADVDGAIVVQQPDLGLVGRRLALARIVLHEAGGQRRRRPRRLVELAVERDRPLRLRRLQPPVSRAPCRNRSRRSAWSAPRPGPPIRQTARQRPLVRVACANSFVCLGAKGGLAAVIYSPEIRRWM